MSPKLLIDILGWAGSILYLLAYALVAAKKTEGDSLLSTGLLRLYQGMDIMAGILLVHRTASLVIYTLSLGAYATTGLNIVWVAIDLSTLRSARVLRLFTLGRKWLTRN